MHCNTACWNQRGASAVQSCMKKLLGSLVLCLALVACGDDGSTTFGTRDDGSPAGALSAARAQWAARGSKSYAIEIEAICFCPERLTLRGEVIDGRPPTVTQPGWFEHRLSVPGLFDYIEKAIKSGAAEVRATYDVATGYPREIFVDRSRAIADEEMFLTIKVTPK